MLRDLAEKATQTDPKNPEPFLLLGRAQYQRGRLEEAMAAWSKTLKLAPGQPFAARMLDMLRAKIERHRWDNVRVFERLPASTGRYDLIVCSSVCAFVDDYPGVVRQLVSSMMPGGLFVQWDWELDPRDDEPGADWIRDAQASRHGVRIRCRRISYQDSDIE